MNKFSFVGEKENWSTLNMSKNCIIERVNKSFCDGTERNKVTTLCDGALYV